MSEAKRVIVLSVDRLRTQFLGCYGNAWIATPAIDRLACESIVFDDAHASGPNLTDFFQSAWHPAAREWIAGATSTFISDDAEATALAGAAGFAEVIELPSGVGAAQAEDLEETHLASVFAAATEQLLQTPHEANLFWLHIGSLGQVWDAPRALRERYHEDDDAPLPEFVEPPCKLLAANFDPDERWGCALAYAAQISTFDACLDLFLEQLRTSALWSNATFLLCGVRGYPLGEHRRVGPFDESLYGELLHVPWIMRLPSAAQAQQRRPELTSAEDLAAIIHGAAPTARERLTFSSAEEETALRTREWFLRRTIRAGEPRVELYVKPDDRWEVNNVHDRCRDVVEELLAAPIQSLPSPGR
ncbi:MAG: sulfatase-like hydrolase/transferase [Planctomycetia bacterium]|nr:sulfatase-like hydrolase/transferase [Planctomycetia bacterium]